MISQLRGLYTELDDTRAEAQAVRAGHRDQMKEKGELLNKIVIVSLRLVDGMTEAFVYYPQEIDGGWAYFFGPDEKIEGVIKFIVEAPAPLANATASK